MKPIIDQCSSIGNAVPQRLISNIFFALSSVEYLYVTVEYYIRFQDFTKPDRVQRLLFFLNIFLSLITGLVALILDILDWFEKFNLVLSLEVSHEVKHFWGFSC